MIQVQLKLIPLKNNKSQDTKKHDYHHSHMNLMKGKALIINKCTIN